MTHALYALAALAAVFAVGSVALAQSDGGIIGCKSDVGGLLRVVSKPSNCKDNETSISWNQQGPKGDRGPAVQPPAFNYARAAGTVNTNPADRNYQALPGGPQVTVTVPASGYVEVGASARISGDSGAVALFDVATGTQVPGQSVVCSEALGAPDNGGLLFASGPSPTAFQYSTPAGSPDLFLGSCGNTGGPSTVLLGPHPQGQRTLQLRYGVCGCSDPPAGSATFSDRKLWARPAPNAPPAP